MSDSLSADRGGAKAVSLPRPAVQPPPRLSPSTRRAYQGEWDRFADWCTATGRPILPTDPEAVAVYLEENPAAPATQARRIAAINRLHLEHGHPAPGHDPAIIDELNALRSRSSERPAPARPSRDAVESVLRLLPNRGWPAGFFGRRDRCLLLLSQIGGLSHTEIRASRLGDIETEDRSVTIHARSRIVRLKSRDDPSICPACIYRRWHTVRDALERLPRIRPLRRQFHQAREVSATSPHICNIPNRLPVSAAPLFIAADRHGWPATHTSLSTRSISTIAAAAARGHALAHATIPVFDPIDPADTPDEPATPVAPLRVRNAAHLRADYEAALARRNQDRLRLDTVEQLLHKLNADLESLDARTTELLNLASRTARPRSPGPTRL
jgi:integrase